MIVFSSRDLLVIASVAFARAAFDEDASCRSSSREVHGAALLQARSSRAHQQSPRPISVQGGGFSLASETVDIEDVDNRPGTPVSDHWSCHQVRQVRVEEVPKSKNIAVLVPFREQSGKERHRELEGLLASLLPYAQELEQNEGVSFKIYVIEQSGDGHFNRGALMDVGFHLAEEFFGDMSFTAIAQDCDFVPDERMIQWYSRSGDGPIHLASYAYCPGFGGVTIFRNDQYRAMDGYSHSMWGWGGEDDDAMDRWMAVRSRVVLAPSGGERFKDLGKSEDKVRDKSHYEKSMAVWKRDNQDQNWVREGLDGLKYTLLSKVPHESPIVEHVVVELGGSIDPEAQL
jgi:hypothetical protein